MTKVDIEPGIGSTSLCDGCSNQRSGRGDSLRCIEKDLENWLYYGGGQHPDYPNCWAARRVNYGTGTYPVISDSIPVLYNGKERCTRYGPTTAQLVRNFRTALGKVVRFEIVGPEAVTLDHEVRQLTVGRNFGDFKIAVSDHVLETRLQIVVLDHFRSTLHTKTKVA